MTDFAYSLPGTLTMVAEAAGLDAALTLALARGGSRFAIPKRAEGSLLADLVGIEAAGRIVEDLAGERLEIPLVRRILAHWLRSQGWSQERVAYTLKVSRRNMQHWDADPPIKR